MKTAKKLLAIVLCFAMLTSLFILDYTVSAEQQPYYFSVLNTGFENTDGKDNTFYSQSSNGYANDDRSVGLVNSSGIGNNGTSGAMKIGYKNNPSNTGLRPVFSLRCSESYNNRNTSQSFKFKSGNTYKLSFYYKAETVTSTVQLWMREYGASLAGAQVDTNSSASTKKLAEISKATNGYVHVEVTFIAQKVENLIFLLKPLNYSDVAGTTLYIDDVTVMEQQMHESSLGSQNFESATSMSGFTTYEDWEISTEQNHTESGSKSARIKIEAGDNSGAGRPRMILNVAGNNFIAKKGETYIVSFWVYAPEEVSTFNWYIYSQKVSTLTSSRVGQSEVEKANVKLSQGWNKITEKITVKGYDGSEHNYLQIGLTDAASSSASYVEKYFYVDDINVQDVSELVTSTLVNQDFADVTEISGKNARKANASISGTGSALTSAKGYKSGVDTAQFYIPGSNQYTRLYGQYDKRYRMTVYVRATADIEAKIRWFGTTTLSDAFNYATNHRVLTEQNISLKANEWTALTLVARTNVDIFESKNIYFTLGATLADNSDSSTECTIMFDNISLNEVTKPNTPGKPVIESYTEDSVTLAELANGEYSIDNINWQDSNVFEGLTPWTTYNFYNRTKATETTLPSDPARTEFVLVLHGDVNMDSDINAEDLSILINVILEKDVEFNATAADVNVDGNTNLLDLVVLKKIIARSSTDDAAISIG